MIMLTSGTVGDCVSFSVSFKGCMLNVLFCLVLIFGVNRALLISFAEANVARLNIAIVTVSDTHQEIK
jgi:hypothetical protein